MRLFLALTYVCGALAAAVPALEPPAEQKQKHGAVSVESDVQGHDAHVVDTTALVGELDARDEPLARAAGPRPKRQEPGRQLVAIPQGRNAVAHPASVSLLGVVVIFQMAQRRVWQGGRQVTRWYCRTIQFINMGNVRRAVTATINGLPFFRMNMGQGAIRSEYVPANARSFDLTVAPVPTDGD
ncbi:hypothetical protein E4U41_007277 [Claviceps citrina]|nr:hypothetical protein E4U41_007277 [Claviceps citrina]